MGHEEYRPTIEPEETPENPRTKRTLGTMMIWHEKFQLLENPNPTLHESPREFKNNFLLRQQGNIIALPVFYYASTNTLSTSPKDGGMAQKIGWIYTDFDAIKKTFEVDDERIPPGIKREAKQVLKNEVAAKSQDTCGAQIHTVFNSR